MGFLSAYIFADLLRLPPVVYHLVYFMIVCGFIILYVACTDVAVPAWLRRRLVPALLFGTLGGLVLMQRVLSDPPSAGPSGLAFVWDLLWRGVIYGTLDGLLLSAFPWLVTWRALGGESSTSMRQAAISALALAMGLGVTSAYHLGYQDFRGPKLLQANVGNAIAALPTLLSRNPLASPMAHAILHVTAVVHNPQSHLFLPPHALRSVRPAATEGVAANAHFRVENAHFQIMDGPDVLQARSVREQRASFGMILNKLRMRDSRRCPSAQAVGW